MLLFLLQGGPRPTSWAGKLIGKPIGPKEKVILGLYEGKMFQLWPCIWSHFANWLPIPPLKLWEKNVAVLSRGWLPQRWQLWFLSLLLPTGCERLQLGWWEPLAGSQGHMQIACHMLFLQKFKIWGRWNPFGWCFSFSNPPRNLQWPSSTPTWEWVLHNFQMYLQYSWHAMEIISIANC